MVRNLALRIGVAVCIGMAFAANGPEVRAQAPAGTLPPEQVVLLSAMVRQARAAQRDCDIVAKRDSVNALQVAMQDIARTMRRQANDIARELDRARSDRLVDADVAQAKTAIDAALLIEDKMKTARNRDMRNRLAALRERYLDFDQWESLYTSLTRVLSRLEGTAGDCVGAGQAAATVTSPANCLPEAFEPCRYGRPTGMVDRDLVIAVPVNRR
jgi:hypothetical protein